MKNKSLLELHKVAITMGTSQIINNLSLKVTGGEIVTIMGPSGSGKSSILNFICGNLIRDFRYSGKVLLNGDDITALPPEKRRVGILFQDDLLFPNMSVAANLAFGVDESITGAARKTIVENALADARLQDYGNKDPATLSGGQRARISVMRALLARPAALLLDEPFNKLDMKLRKKFRSFVFSHARKAKIPCILVTHDIDDATAAKGKIIMIKPIYTNK